MGIQNFLHLSEIYKHLQPRVIAKHAFVNATWSASAYDRTVFTNDSDEAVTLQTFLEVLKIKKVEDIPLSCKHLAIFHTFAIENGTFNIKQFLQEIKQLKSIEEIDDKCKNEFKRRNLD